MNPTHSLPRFNHNPERSYHAGLLRPLFEKGSAGSLEHYVLLYIAGQMYTPEGHNRDVFMQSEAMVAEKTGLSRRSVNGILQSIVNKGLLTRDMPEYMRIYCYHPTPLWDDLPLPRDPKQVKLAKLQKFFGISAYYSPDDPSAPEVLGSSTSSLEDHEAVSSYLFEHFGAHPTCMQSNATMLLGPCISEMLRVAGIAEKVIAVFDSLPAAKVRAIMTCSKLGGFLAKAFKGWYDKHLEDALATDTEAYKSMLDVASETDEDLLGNEIAERLPHLEEWLERDAPGHVEECTILKEQDGSDRLRLILSPASAWRGSSLAAASA